MFYKAWPVLRPMPKKMKKIIIIKSKVELASDADAEKIGKK
jgi:hypothetical protein